MLRATFLPLLIAGMAFVDSGSAVRIASALPGSKCLTPDPHTFGNGTNYEWTEVILTNCTTAPKWGSYFYTIKHTQVTSGFIYYTGRLVYDDLNYTHIKREMSNTDMRLVALGPPIGRPVELIGDNPLSLYDKWQIFNDTDGNKNLNSENLTSDASGYVGPIHQVQFLHETVLCLTAFHLNSTLGFVSTDPCTGGQDQIWKILPDDDDDV